MKHHLIRLAVVAGLTQLPVNTAMAQWQPAQENLEVKQHRAAFDRINRQFSVLVKITNTSDDTLSMPLRLHVNNSTHEVTNAQLDGDISYVPVDVTSLKPGETVTVPVYLAFARKRLVLDVALMQESGPGNNWQLIWQDEFDGNTIDTNKWNFEENCWGGGNNEQQCYTDRSENAFLEDGKLVIKAQREDFTGPDNPEGNPDSLATLPYTSARLRTLNQGDWTYGRFEIRAKLPYGQGTWPAIWMLPSDYKYGTWAASGEIDIMEAVNLKTPSDDPAAAGMPEDRVYGTLHFGRTWPGNVYVEAEHRLPNNINPADGFHTYAIEWEQGEIRWYVDGYHFATQTQDGWYTQYQDESGQWQTGVSDAPFNERFHLLLNLAVGGNWAANTNETGIDESVFPQTMEVDFVRVYECSINPATGQGCATIGDNPHLPEGIEPPPLPGESSLVGEGPVFMLFDDAFSEKLSIQSYNPDGTVTSYVESAEDRGEVFTMEQLGNVGNVFFNADAPINLQHFEQLGKLKFDIRTLNRAPGAELLVKIDSGWPAVGDTQVSLTDDGQWQSVSIDISDIVEAGNRFAPGNTTDLAQVLNPFVLEANGPMTVQVDNVRYEYDLAGKSEVIVFDDSDNPPFAAGKYVASGSVDVEQVVSADGGYGDVKQFSFNTNESVVYFQTPVNGEGQTQKIDFTGFDTLSFDLKVVDDPRTNQDFFIKMDCGHPCSSGDFAIETPDTGIWTHYDIPVSELIDNLGSTLDLSRVDTPLVIFPAWGNQQGVVMQIDNIVLTGDGETSPTPDVVTITDTFSVFDEALATGWSLWDCCANANLSVVNDNERGNVAQLDYFGPAPTVSGFRANKPHDATAVQGGVLTFSMKMVSAPDDASASLLLKVEGGDGTFAELPISMNLEGAVPQVGLWQQYSFSLADLASQGLSLDKLNLIMMFPEWNKATGAVLQIDDLTIMP